MVLPDPSVPGESSIEDDLCRHGNRHKTNETQTEADETAHDLLLCLDLFFWEGGGV